MTAVRAVVPSTLQRMSEDRKELARKSLREAEALWQKYNITPLPPLSAFEKMFKVVCISPEERETAIDKAKSQRQIVAESQGYVDDDKSTASTKRTGHLKAINEGRSAATATPFEWACDEKKRKAQEAQEKEVRCKCKW
jgi:hypothetical protein